MKTKINEDLLRLARRMPHRFVEQEGHWRCLPGESYARQFGSILAVSDLENRQIS